MVTPELVIDLREEHELLEKILISPHGKYEIINIPSRHIFANVSWINRQTEKRPVWLICASGRRSQEIKDKYFPKNDGIKSSIGGLTFSNGDGNKNSESVDGDHITIKYGQGGFGIQQYMQIAFAGMLVVALSLVYFNVKRNISLFIILAMIVAVLGQTFTKNCMLSKILPKSVFVESN